ITHLRRQHGILSIYKLVDCPVPSELALSGCTGRATGTFLQQSSGGHARWWKQMGGGYQESLPLMFFPYYKTNPNKTTQKSKIPFFFKNINIYHIFLKKLIINTPTYSPSSPVNPQKNSKLVKHYLCVLKLHKEEYIRNGKSSDWELLNRREIDPCQISFSPLRRRKP
ncbi:hypothetical protein VP01_5060g1, partial [Puccinia sorghi]